MTRRNAVSASILALLSLAGCSSSGTSGAGPGSGGGAPGDAPTYYRDVKPIVEVKCNGCHVEGGIAPFALATYEQVSAQKAAIKGAVQAGTMPPWPPAKGCSDYLGDRSLTEEQIKTLADWADAGGPAGDPSDKPVTVADTRTTLSRVDRTLKMPVAYTPQIKPDDYRCFLVDWPDAETSYVTGLGVQPDNAAIVHHVIAFLAKPDTVADFQALDDAEEGPGWTCFGGPGGKATNTGWVGAWAPGALGEDYPAGTGIEIPPGSKIVMQVHYNTSTAAPAPDQSSIVLKVDKTVEKKAVIMPWTDIQWVLQQKMDIPAHSMDAVKSYAADPTPFMDYLAKDIIAPSTPFTIYSAGLHMHTRGTHAVTKIERAGGGEECMLDIPRWNFHWQGSYGFEAPKTFHPGDKLSLECHWNNSGDSDLNWGEGTGDEMCLSIFYATQ
jgi:hypothetical protein